MTSIELQINDDHPLALELTSLRTAVALFQHEAHASSLKLQRQSLDSTLALERAQDLERENAALREEIAALHSHPDVSPHTAALQVPELTLALRRISDKLTTTEETLLTRTTELAHALAATAKAKHEVEGAYELAAHTRAREEEGKVLQRELQRKVRAAEEERRMTDRVVEEYADLVRTLEGRQSLTGLSSPSRSTHTGNGTARLSNTTLVDGLKDGKTGLQKLLEEFNGETQRFEAEIGRLHSELEVAEAKWEAERKSAEQDRVQMAQARSELEKYQADDNSAAKMVSRYMKFSQSTTNALQQSLESLKARHTASISTLQLEVSTLQSSLASERRQTERLRDVLDELTEQLAQEAYGRRREVALRLAVVGREDALAEALRRWLRRAKETIIRTTVEDASSEAMRLGFESVVGDAGELLIMADADPRSEGEVVDAGLGSVARILAAQDAVKTLVEELQNETEKRMQLERILGRTEVDKDGQLIPVAVKIARSPAIAPSAMQVDAVTSSKPLSSAQVPATLADSTDSPIAQSLPLVPDPVPPPGSIEQLSSADVASAMTVAAVEILHQPSPRLPEELKTPVSLVESLSVTENSRAAMFPSADPVQLGQTSSFIMALPDASGVEDETTLHSTYPPAAASPSHPPLLSVPSSQPLLIDLAKVKNRYDTLQRAFRDCHLALRDLKETIPSLHTSPFLSVLQAAVTRLDDYNEDARVELEIRVSDEERVSRGYEILLSVPGAISSDAETAEIEAAVRAFVDGTEAAVARAQSQFTHKLDDLEHDVAAVKRALHELLATVEPDVDSTPPKQSANSSWTSLTAGFFTPPRPTSPAPTFGSVMTSPRPHRAPPSAHLHARSGSSDSISGGLSSPNGTPSPFASLDLRISMPAHVMSSTPASLARSPPRARKTSGMYMLGLGMRSASLVGSGGNGRSASMMSLQRPMQLEVEAERVVLDEETNTSDVE
ncbi:hypothetical protein EW146_g531 [Bondarzewia mesenterica]|uniref:Uncharacterized protein n=1 Tax=Bondarzewia mesenterica TaxID=1095465 RepID=A0A4S4M6I2_9AGAM|nr:hypothetical protein EW146_g531 [Bondarzewia mesenterica]